jgi:hypothetical protein
MKADPINPTIDGRRELLRVAASAAGLALTGCAMAGGARGSQAAAGQDEHAEAEVTPGEDLMQEPEDDGNPGWLPFLEAAHDREKERRASRSRK